MTSKELQSLRFQHSVAFKYINEDEAQIKVRPQTVKDSDRVPCFPALVPDLSVESVEETRKRRTMHAEILNKDKTAFRRRVDPVSCANFVVQRMAVKDLLTTMHPIRDEGALVPPKTGYTYTKRDDSRPRELYTNIEDFLQPGDLCRPRSTGFSPGHLRSMAGFDSFGPSHSEELSMSRSIGLLPASPNPDRNSPSTKSRSVSRLGTRTPLSGSDSRSGTKCPASWPRNNSSRLDGMENVWGDIFADFPKSPTSQEPEQMTDTFQSTRKSGLNTASMASTRSLSRMGTYNSSMRSNVIDADDRLLVDPRARGLLYDEAYRQYLENLASSRREEQDMRKSREREQAAGEFVQAHISSFEDKLKSMNRYS